MSRAVVAERDGPFGDYSQAPARAPPDPRHVIKVDIEDELAKEGPP